MADRELSTIRDLIHPRYATIIVKSAVAASDGESRLKYRSDKKFLDFHPAAAATAQARPTKATWPGTA